MLTDRICKRGRNRCPAERGDELTGYAAGLAGCAAPPCLFLRTVARGASCPPNGIVGCQFGVSDVLVPVGIQRVIAIFRCR